MIKRMLLMLIVVGLIGVGIVTFKNFQSTMIKKFMGQMSSQPQTVSTVIAQYSAWDTRIQAVGTLRAVSGVDISSEVSGIIEGLYFESGDQVTVGTLLAKLRAEDDIAYLGSLKAEAHLAQLTYDRDVQQLRKNAVSQSAADLSLANLEKALALISQQEAIIAKKSIRAPFSGRLGLRQIDLGEYINPGNVIVSLQELDPIYFDFYLPQQQIAEIDINDPVELHTNIYPDQVFPGKIWAINSKVDQSSRNIQVRATLENPEKKLLPGMYAVVDVDLGKPQKYITLPQTAITYNPYGDTVFLAKQNGTGKDGKTQYITDQKFVTLGPTRGDQIAIISGLDSGEMVIVAGQIKLQKGTPIIINNEVMPTNDVNPAPSEQ